jgi:imidazolonepropionase-like amidohydrolase
MPRIPLAAAMALLAGLAAGAQQPADRLIAIRAGRLLDPASGRIDQNVTVVVRGDRIESVGAAPPAGATTIDLTGYTVLPGLVDAHTHVMLQPEDEEWPPPVVYKTQAFRTIQGVAAAKRDLEAGFTTLRDLDSEGAGLADVALRDAIEKGIVPGPRLLVATYAITITAGHMNITGVNPEADLPDLAAIADTRESMVTEVRRQVKAGADWIKLYATGTLRHVDRKTLEPVGQVSEEDAAAVVAEARRWRKDVAAHAYGGDGAKNAIRGGIRSLEHGMFLDDEAIQLMKERGTFYCPTMIAYVGGLKADKTDFTSRLVARHKDSFQRAMKAGVKIVFGTDAGAVEHGTQAGEFELMVSYGMSPLDAIRAATTRAAELLRREGEVGTLAKGGYADLIAVEGNPLEDIKALQHVRFVMKGGDVVRRAAARGGSDDAR